MKQCIKCGMMGVVEISHFENKKCPMKYQKCKNPKCGSIKKISFFDIFTKELNKIN